MDQLLVKLLLAIVVVSFLNESAAQHEDIPYQDVEKICETCICLSAQDGDEHNHLLLNCALKNFEHILARWPEEFGKSHNNADLVASFSGNSIEILQQLPATTASLTFACRHCGIKHLQVPTFMDVPNIKRLDLSYNELTTDELTADVFRGPYRTTRYEPIALIDLDLSHNQLHSLDKKLFEHTPNITKLSLSHNKFDVLDNPTSVSLASASSLETLDLSHTDIETIPPTVLKALTSLKSLNLAGNKFITLPESLQLVGKSLENLNLASNQIESFSEQTFLGLKALKRLNISDMQSLKSITKGTFTRLEALQYLTCSHNPNLEEFDLDSLVHSSNLTQLDISYCSITTLSLDLDLSQTISSNTTNTSLPNPWPRLHKFEMVGNPWLCDCVLLQTMEFVGAQSFNWDSEVRCDSPYILSGAGLFNFTAEKICSLQIPKKYRVVDEDPPRFRRKRYIILTAITASVVIVLGLLIGFVVVCIRRRLKRDDFGVEPIRYTSVRSSNLSAFSHVNQNNA